MYRGYTNLKLKENWACFVKSAPETGRPDPVPADAPLDQYVAPLNARLTARIAGLKTVAPNILQEMAGKQANMALRRKLICLVNTGRTTREGALYNWYQVSGAYGFAPFSCDLRPENPYRLSDRSISAQSKQLKARREKTKRAEITARICADIDQCWARIIEDERQHHLAGHYDSSPDGSDMPVQPLTRGQRVLRERTALHKNIFRRSLIKAVNEGRTSRRAAVLSWVDFCLREKLKPFTSPIMIKAKAENLPPRKIKIKHRRP